MRRGRKGGIEKDRKKKKEEEEGYIFIIHISLFLYILQ
jgi:hypothetical protein